ncbi:protein jagged-2-like [Paramacrobiotus metropolitanus]|uniref:protein jagged-2-like n=1 Tax=Paramacrobiotus metropolitanus TaxID=2943436 RepID=UPI002445D13B|nr:protein jagged-2-like [Paramacrobiotus metropolitanus]
MWCRFVFAMRDSFFQHRNFLPVIFDALCTPIYKLSLSGILLLFLACSIKVAEASGQVQLEILSVKNIHSDPTGSVCCTRGSATGQSQTAAQRSAPGQDAAALPVAGKPAVPSGGGSTQNSSHDQAASSSCFGICRPYFRLCFKQYQQSVSLDDDCTYGQGFSPLLTLPYISPSNAHVGSLASWAPPSPVTFLNNNSFVAINLPFDFAWKKSYTLILDLLNAQDESPDSSDISLERAVQSEEIGPRDDWRVFVHSGKKAVIRYRLRIVCDEFYGSETCNTFCKARNDFFGHWFCSPDAEKVCLDGWTGSNCDKAICAPGCQNGVCSVPGECRCRNGWKGEKCDQCVPHPACKHGTCTDKPGECVCDKDWGGPMCDHDLNYCAKHKPCFNHAICYNVDDGKQAYECRCPEGFGGLDCSQTTEPCVQNPCRHGECYANNGTAQCRCDVGWVGDLCELVKDAVDNDECVSNPCANGATCKNEIGYYRCICPDGFSGEQCQNKVKRVLVTPTAMVFTTPVPVLPENTTQSALVPHAISDASVEQLPTKLAHVDSTIALTAIVSVILVLVILVLVLVALVFYHRRQRSRRYDDSAFISEKYSLPSNNRQVTKDLLSKDQADLLAQRNNQDNEVRLKILNNVLKETKIPMEDEMSNKSDDLKAGMLYPRTPDPGIARYICGDPSTSYPVYAYDNHNNNRPEMQSNKNTKNSFMESLRAARNKDNNGSVGMEYFSAPLSDGKVPVEDFTVV